MKKIIILMVSVVLLTLMLSAFAQGAALASAPLALAQPAVAVTVDDDTTPECSDGIDNDDDDLVDFRGGCDSDGDGVVDLVGQTCSIAASNQGQQYYARDTACSSLTDTSEASTISVATTDEDDGTTVDAPIQIAPTVPTQVDCCDCVDTEGNYIGPDACDIALGSHTDGETCRLQIVNGVFVPASCLEEIDTGYEPPTLTVPTDEDEDEQPSLPECSDEIDNDGDGLTDYPADTCCNSANEDSERGTLITYGTCMDGIDNDGDSAGLIDANDPSCITRYYPEDPVLSAMLYSAAQQNTETAQEEEEESEGIISRFTSLFRRDRVAQQARMEARGEVDTDETPTAPIMAAPAFASSTS